MSKLRMVGTFAIASGVALFLFLGMGNLKSFAGPNYRELALLTNVLHLVQQHYVDDVDEHTLIEGALKGMLDVLDPHTSYLSADFYKEVQLDTKGEFEGLGIEITKRDGFVMVVAPIDGTPAAKAGIKAKDEIVAVCPSAEDDSCVSTQDMNLLEAVKLMRGPRGTKVMIQIRREGWTTPKPFVIKRASIRVSSVRMSILEPGLPYVRLSQFQERTTRDLAAALKQAHKETGEFKGLVLDLRNNPGGLLEQAVRVTDLFLEEGMIVFSEGRDSGNHMEWHAKGEGTEPKYPMVVLVNGGSASASEIVAGALQDHHRALVLGSETFGKGSVQTIIPLDDGSGLRLTTALYYLPSGRSIQEVRIQPDVLIEPYTQAELAAIENEDQGETFGEEHLAGHLESKKAKPESNEPNDPMARQLELDRQLIRATELLKSWNIFSNLELGSGA
ncbi:MAG: S41 family peptidase [Myxococcales bacterium]|nr:S41 family peptidase [Myxococcales bacterium]